MQSYPALFAALLLVGCQSSEEWPSLAYRPGEGRPLGCGGQIAHEAPAMPGAEAPELAAPAPLNSAPLAAQARDICASLDLLERQWQSAALKAEESTAAAQNSAAGSPEWGAAQIALSQMDKIGSDIAEQQRRADDLEQAVRRAGLVQEDNRPADPAQEKNVALILDTAKRAGQAVTRHLEHLAALSARLAVPE